MTEFNMREAIRAHLDPLESFTAAIEAHKLADNIDDDEFAAWAVEHKAAIIGREMGEYLRSYRSATRANRARSAFADAVEELEDGGDVFVFAQTFVVDDEFTRKRLGDLDRDDLLFVADSYGATRAEAAFEEAVFRALAKKVGRRKVADVLTEEQYRALRSSFAGDA